VSLKFKGGDLENSSSAEFPELVLAKLELTPRQRREFEYHRQRSAELADQKIAEPIPLDVIKQANRWWWNAYWETYRLAVRASLQGKRVLVPGCGFGEDAIRLACLGAEVYAFDLSPGSVDIARQRARKMNLDIVFNIAPAEKTTYPDRFFDAVWFLDILHHVDIENTVKEMRRILKPGALVLGDELYTHSWLERIRKSRLVAGWLYPKMQRFIYGQERPYITQDEHKINEREFGIVSDQLMGLRCQYFNVLIGRVLPQDFKMARRLDRLLLMLVGGYGRFLAGRVVFIGVLKS
jgi:2-polyprenyl-3-methyl-5-hydroxy-6-metoxy-1,4-benzoquinol methylase